MSHLNILINRELRSLVIDLVLATDMSNHFQQIKSMKSLITAPDKWDDSIKFSNLTLFKSSDPRFHISVSTWPGSFYKLDFFCSSASTNPKFCLWSSTVRISVTQQRIGSFIKDGLSFFWRNSSDRFLVCIISMHIVAHIMLQLNNSCMPILFSSCFI